MIVFYFNSNIFHLNQQMKQYQMIRMLVIYNKLFYQEQELIKIRMLQQEELGDFKPIHKEDYQQVTQTDEITNLYIHKIGYPNVMVRAPNAHKKTHCWRLKTLQITQYATQNGAREKAVAQIQFDGQLIFTLIDLFNQMMGKQILQYVENITNQLRQWCDAPIKNIFLLSEKTLQSLGFKHGFIKINPILFYIDRNYFFEYRRWTGEIDSDVPEIETALNVQGTSNYSGMFDYVCQRIKKQKQYRRTHKDRKLKKQLMQKQEKQRKIKQRQLLQKQSEDWYYEDSINPVKFQQLEEKDNDI